MVDLQVKKYNAIVTYSGVTWEATEQFNTMGTISVNGAAGTTAFSNTDNLFTENKVSIKLTSATANRGQLIALISPSEIDISHIGGLAGGDTYLIEIEVFDLNT